MPLGSKGYLNTEVQDLYLDIKERECGNQQSKSVGLVPETTFIYFYENTDWEIHYLADSKLTRFLNALINRLICNIQTILLAVDPLLNVRN